MFTKNAKLVWMRQSQADSSEFDNDVPLLVTVKMRQTRLPGMKGKEKNIPDSDNWAGNSDLLVKIQERKYKGQDGLFTKGIIKRLQGTGIMQNESKTSK